MVLYRFTVPFELQMVPPKAEPTGCPKLAPAPPAALFEASVRFISVAVPLRLKRPPPVPSPPALLDMSGGLAPAAPPTAIFAMNVQLVAVNVPRLQMAPPLPIPPGKPAENKNPPYPP